LKADSESLFFSCPAFVKKQGFITIQYFCILRLRTGHNMKEEEFRKLTEGLLNGERLNLSKAITLAETTSPLLFSFRNRLLEIAEKSPRPASFRLAVTGVPGAGKSTLINQLGIQWIADGHKVAVLAVDPSSDVSLGSILGDKTRMAELAREENAYIRPSPTRLHLGGVASSTFETILLCEVAGFDRIIIETVGVGQSELEVSQLTDACLLLLIAGTGDELQAVKRGILETADFILVNKADSDNREKALAYARELRQISSLWQKKRHEEPAEILCGSGTDPEFIRGCAELTEAFFLKNIESGFIVQNRKIQLERRAAQLLKSRLEEKIIGSDYWKNLLSQLQHDIQSGDQSLFEAVHSSASRIRISTID
jgi:LAO/AO transport system kinase